jgi:hypothetical protein
MGRLLRDLAVVGPGHSRTSVVRHVGVWSESDWLCWCLRILPLTSSVCEPRHIQAVYLSALMKSNEAVNERESLVQGKRLTVGVFLFRSNYRTTSERNRVGGLSRAAKEEMVSKRLADQQRMVSWTGKR